MAISFSRPDPSSPAAVADANFPTARRGFDQQQVRDFLRLVAAELTRAHDREKFLEQELRTRREEAARPQLPDDLDDETASRLLGEETARILQAARESAALIKTKAEDAAETALRDIDAAAKRIRDEADQYAARRRNEAESDAAEELELAKQQGREMVDEARAYRERVFGELARRRDLARQQIDQLVHARERLLQVFERARLAAADVVGELTPLGELADDVDLSPTTGPVPIVRRGQQPPRPTAEPPAASADEPASEPPVADEATADTVDNEVAAPADTTADDDPNVEPPDDAAAATGDDEQLQAADESDEDAAPSSDDITHPLPTVDTAAAEVGRDATVLRFPGRHADDATTTEVDDNTPADETPTDESISAEEIDDDDVTASDVDDLFARLRATQPDEDATELADGTDTESDIESGDARAPFVARDELLTPLITAAARKLKRVLADEQNQGLDRLRHKEPVTALEQLLPAADEHVDRYFSAIETELLTAARGGGSSLGDGTAPGVDELNLADLAAVRDSLTSTLIAPLRDRLVARITDGDGDNEVITASLRSVYREWKTKHIDDHLDDFLRAAYTRGVLTCIADGTPLRWIADPDVGACSECEDNSLESSVEAGSAFPTGHLAPPAHGGCRCLVAPVAQ